MHAAFACFCNPTNYDRDYRIFNVSTQSFNARVDTRVCLCLFCEDKMAAFFGGGGAEAPFFIQEGPWAPFYKILEATLMFVCVCACMCLHACM